MRAAVWIAFSFGSRRSGKKSVCTLSLRRSSCSDKFAAGRSYEGLPREQTHRAGHRPLWAFWRCRGLRLAETLPFARRPVSPEFLDLVIFSELLPKPVCVLI